MEALERLKQCRKDKGITLKELSRLTDLSANYLGQIERGQANPSIAALKKITDSLGITLMSLVEEIGENGRPIPTPPSQPVEVVRAGARKTLIYPGGARRASLLTPDLQGALEVIITVEDPAPEGTGEWYSHEGEEFGLVLEGTYEVVVEDRTYLLEEGDSIRFKSNIPHQMRNPGEKPSKTLWVITPPSF